MARIDVKIPALGEGIIEVTITKWLVKAGDLVVAEQPLAEIATDKIDSEILSPGPGTVVKLIYPEGDIPKVNEVIAILETDIHHVPRDDVKAVPEAIAEPRIMKQNSEEKKNNFISSGPVKKSLDLKGNLNFSPFIRYLARQRGISFNELQSVQGTGIEGIITRDDLQQYILSRGPKEDTSHEPANLPRESLPEIQDAEKNASESLMETESIPMDRVRKIIAANMVLSKHTSPHVTSFAEADVTALLEWRNRNKENALSKYGFVLTITPLFIEATAKALQEYPRINVSVEGDNILLKKSINIGIATALPDGNLIVPVVKKADCMNLQGLAARMNDLVNRARSNSLLPAEIKGGTFTVTNIGQYKSLTGTPIINPPESAILAIGAITRKPWAVKISQGYGIALRDIIMLSLTYDHRVIDGALGGNFLSRIAWLLENFNTAREL